MAELTQLQPAPPANVPQARPITPLAATGPPAKPPVDRCAIASAIFGITGIVPVVSQVAGVVLGIMALCRIRRARREGLVVAGTGWAVTGIVSSVAMLLCWILVAAALGAAVSVFAKTSSVLDQAITLPHR